MRFLVLYDITPDISDWAKSLADFDLEKCSFKNAPQFVRDDGDTVIDYNWILAKADPVKYDGVIAYMKGNRLSGVWGIHNKQLIKGKRFSIIQVEHHPRMYRELKGLAGFAEMVGTKKRTAYPQGQYTLDHELLHGLAWLKNKVDMLHTYIKFRLYELYKNNFNPK